MMIMIRCAEHHPEGEALGAARIHSLGRKIMKKTTKLSCGKCSGFRGLLLAAALGAGVGLLSFLPFLLRSRGQYLDGGDYYAQYVPFLLELKRMISSGSLAWSWNSFLGDSFASAYSYYTAFNPFAWIAAMFPESGLLYGTALVTLLKFSVSMVGAMLYMRRFCREDAYALIGALLYTFSGFTVINTDFYFFLDVIAVFPYLMYGLERLIVDGKAGAYIPALVLNAAINFYFFIATVFLVILYVVFRLELYRPSGWKRHWKAFVSVAVCSIIGAGLACFALVPSFFGILGSGKAMSSVGTKFTLAYPLQDILERLRAFVSPIESGIRHAFYDCRSWSSTALYLPVFGVCLAVSWCVSEKGWLKNACLALSLCLFVPLLNAVFNLFTSAGYTRWLYGLVLLLCLATVLSLERIGQGRARFPVKILAGQTVLAGILLLVPTAVYGLYRLGFCDVTAFASACTSAYFIGYRKLLIMLLLTAANYGALWYLARAREFRMKRTVWIVIAACAVNFAVFNEMNYDYASCYDVYQTTMVQGCDLDGGDMQYRADYPSGIQNYGLFQDVPSVNYYNSMQNPNSTRFAQAVGIANDPRDIIFEMPAAGREALGALLSVRYYLDYTGDAAIPQGFRFVKTENGVDLYENDNYIPMGFVYDTYCPESRLVETAAESRAAVMLKSLVIPDEDEALVREYLREDTSAVVPELSEMSARRRETVCGFFAGTSRGFSAEITLDRKNIVFFSIPNSPGWTITVNGEQADTLEVNYGLMGICCEAGENRIEAVYHTRGWIPGIALSALSGIVWLALAAIKKSGKVAWQITLEQEK